MGSIKSKVKIWFVLPLLFLSSCISIPRQSVELSAELTQMTIRSRQSHLELLDAYTMLRRDQAERFLEEEWIPTFTANFVQESNILNNIEDALTPEAKGAEILEFAQAALPRINERRNSLFGVINGMDLIVRNRIDSHYQEMLNVNNALTAHLESAAKVVEIRQQLQSKMNVNVEELVPLDKMNEIMEKLLKSGAQAEQIPSLLKEFKNKIKK